MSKSPQDVLSQIKDEGIELIDLKFTDIHGKWQHLTPVSYTHLTLPTILLV